MVKLMLGRVDSKSTEIRDAASYASVAREYYDVRLHPTCADFRSASLIYLKKEFAASSLHGRVADLGCGESLLVQFVPKGLVLIDESKEMLDRNAETHEKRQINIEKSAFGVSEFDWIFSILGDPYNVPEAWKNISLALKSNGECVFVVPSYVWAVKFRKSVPEERPGYARFDLADGSSAFLPSFIWSEADQIRMIQAAGLRVAKVDHIFAGELGAAKSQKVCKYLAASDPILDIYRALKQ